MKKAVNIVSLALVCALVLFTAGCSKDKVKYSETFAGVLSEETYDTKDAAAEAFLQNEISGNSTQAVFVSVETKQELSQKEMDSLAIPAEEKADIEKVEEVIITYLAGKPSADVPLYNAAPADEEQDDGEADAPAAADAKTMTARAYLMTYKGGAVRYYVPPLVTGETLTKSYFDSVFDSDKYKNCTYDFKSVGLPGDDVEWDAIAKISENGYCETDTYRRDGETYSFERYLVFDGANEIEAEYDSKYGEWDVCVYELEDDEDFDEELDELASVILLTWFGGAIDYTYFVKTETGFALDSDKVTDYMAAFSDLDWALDYWATLDVSVEFNVFVSEGRIYRCTQKAAYGKDGKMTASSYDLRVKDVGKTKVELSKAAQEEADKEINKRR